MTLHQQGRLEQEQLLNESVLRADPSNADACHLPGLISLQHQEFETFESRIGEAIKLNPGNPTYYVNHGIALIQSKLEAGIALHVDGNFSQAQLVYEEILAQQPQHYDALHLLGVLAMQAGDLERAVDFFGKAIAIHPNNFGFYINQGNALKGLVRLDAALASFDKAIALNPEVPDIYVMRGEVLQELFQFDAAIASFDQAIAINPGFHAAQEARALVLRLHDQK